MDKKPKKRRYSEVAGTFADWGTVDGTILRNFIAAVTRDGTAVRLGYSRDGGVFNIGIYEKDEKYNVWVKPSEDINAKLQEITESFIDG